MQFQSLLLDLAKLDLPSQEFVVVASGPLAVRGIREAEDVDIIVTPHLWNDLARKYPVTKKKWGTKEFDHIEIGTIEVLGSGSMFTDSSVIQVEEIFSKADVIDGIKYLRLEYLKLFKEKLGREVDKRDIELIEQHLLNQ